MYTSYSHRRRRKTGGSCLTFLLFTVTLGVTVFFLFKSAIRQEGAVISPIPDDYTPPPPVVRLFLREKNPDQLRKLIKDKIGASWNNYSIYVVDLNSKFVMGMNEASIYSAASVNKIPILAALYVR